MTTMQQATNYYVMHQILYSNQSADACINANACATVGGLVILCAIVLPIIVAIWLSRNLK